MEARKGVGFPEAEVTDSCEPTSVGARNQIQTLWKTGSALNSWTTSPILFCSLEMVSQCSLSWPQTHAPPSWHYRHLPCLAQHVSFQVILKLSLATLSHPSYYFMIEKNLPLFICFQVSTDLEENRFAVSRSVTKKAVLLKTSCFCLSFWVFSAASASASPASLWAYPESSRQNLLHCLPPSCSWMVANVTASWAKSWVPLWIECFALVAEFLTLLCGSLPQSSIAACCSWMENY